MPPSALIIVDLQRGFINEHTRQLPAAVERAQEDFDRVIATRYYHEPGSLLRC